MRSPPATRPPVVLVADADEGSRAAIRTLLDQQGHQVTEACDARDCLEALGAAPPDLLICDSGLVSSGGIDLSAALRGDDRLRRIPLLLLIDSPDEDSVLAWMEAGADDCLAKPPNPGLLIARARTLLHHRTLHDEVQHQRGVIRRLLGISAFSPDYVHDTERMYLDFTRQALELLHSKRVALVFEDQDTVPTLLSAWPPEDGESLESLPGGTALLDTLIADGEPLVIRPEERERLTQFGLSGGFAGVPIFAFDGRIVGAVLVYGMPSGLPNEDFLVFRTLVQRIGTELQLRQQSHQLARSVASRTRELQRALTHIEDAKERLERAHEETIFRLARAAEFRDDDTGIHLHRISRYSTMLAYEAGMSEADIALLRHASMMHDLGKVAIPDAILLKPGKLSPEEWKIMRTHAAQGAEILRGSGSAMLQMSERIAMSHHERWDGAGYPAGVSGEEIPLEARIVAVADVFDALTSERPYKRAWPLAEAFDHLETIAGSQLDPDLVEAFLCIRSEISQVARDLHEGSGDL